MTRRSRADMIEETHGKLLRTAREAFGAAGYANTSMDDFTAQAGLTRGALYHHFGDKKGLLAAVVAQIDAEVDARLRAITDAAPDPWEGFRKRCQAYLEMALEPEIQRIILRDAKAVLGGPRPDSQRHCLTSMQRILERLMQEGFIVQSDAEALAVAIYGMQAEAACWIAADENGEERLPRALQALDRMLDGLQRGRDRP